MTMKMGPENHKSFWYVATPLTQYPGSRDAALLFAQKQTGILIEHGVPAISPVVHNISIITDRLRQQLSIFTEYEEHRFWMDFNYQLMYSAEGLIYVKGEGHENSRGMSEEEEFFLSSERPVLYMNPYEFPHDEFWSYVYGSRKDAMHWLS